MVNVLAQPLSNWADAMKTTCPDVQKKGEQKGLDQHILGYIYLGS